MHIEPAGRAGLSQRGSNSKMRVVEVNCRQKKEGGFLRRKREDEKARKSK